MLLSFVTKRVFFILFFLFQLCSGKSGIFCPSLALIVKPTRTQMIGKGRGMKITCQATSIPADRVPDMEKRNLLNLLLLGALSLPTAGMLVPYATFFAPPGYVLYLLLSLLLFFLSESISKITSLWNWVLVGRFCVCMKLNNWLSNSIN